MSFADNKNSNNGDVCCFTTEFDFEISFTDKTGVEISEIKVEILWPAGDESRVSTSGYTSNANSWQTAALVKSPTQGACR